MPIFVSSYNKTQNHFKCTYALVSVFTVLSCCGLLSTSVCPVRQQAEQRGGLQPHLSSVVSRTLAWILVNLEKSQDLGSSLAWALMTSQQRKWVGLDYNCQTTTHMHDRSWRDYNRRCLLYYNFFPVTNNNTVSLVLWNYFSETRFTSTKFCNQKVKDQRNKMFIVHR